MGLTNLLPFFSPEDDLLHSHRLLGASLSRARGLGGFSPLNHPFLDLSEEVGVGHGVLVLVIF